VERGEVWWADLPEPWGHRPVVLVARYDAYTILTWVAVAPVTTRLRRLPTAVPLDPDVDGVPDRSIVLLDHVQTIPREWLATRITRLHPEKMQQIDRAIHFALALQNCP
jgi:mRNA interferase MazF